MKRMVVVLTATLIVGALAAGCASSKKTASTASSVMSTSIATSDVGGNWSGRAGAQGRETPVTLRLVQSGTTLAGDVFVGGREDLSGPIKGTVEGTTLRLALGSGFGHSSALHVSADGGQIIGNMAGAQVRLMRTK